MQDHTEKKYIMIWFPCPKFSQFHALLQIPMGSTQPTGSYAVTCLRTLQLLYSSNGRHTLSVFTGRGPVDMAREHGQWTRVLCAGHKARYTLFGHHGPWTRVSKKTSVFTGCVGHRRR